MENLKIKVNSVEESNKAQELFEALGYDKGRASHGDYPATIIANLKDGKAYSSRAVRNNHEHHADYRLVTIQELKDMVVLHRNDVSDATHYRNDGKPYFQTFDKERHYHFQDDEWILSTWMNYQLLPQLKPITKEPTMQKEYLQKLTDGTYKLVVLDSVVDGHEGLIEVPEGADCYVGYNGDRQNWRTFHFGRIKNGRVNEIYKDGNEGAYHNSVNELIERGQMIWQRHTQPEELPFVDDEPMTEDDFNKSVADNVNHPSHYTNGKTECIDALESATVGKTGIEAVCTANIIKYLWRYEDKNGLEDVKKAQWYLNKLISHLEPK